MTNRDGTVSKPKGATRSRPRPLPKNVIELSTGVKLKCKCVPQWLLVDILNEKNKEKPEVPKYYDERRKMELDNPDDPEYQKALSDWTINTGLLYGDVMVAEGTEIYFIPDKCSGPDDETWINRMRFYGRPIDDDFKRYLMWVKYVAAPDLDTDYNMIMNTVGRLSGAREDDVTEAVKSFRSAGARTTNKTATDK